MKDNPESETDEKTKKITLTFSEELYERFVNAAFKLGFRSHMDYLYGKTQEIIEKAEQKNSINILSSKLDNYQKEIKNFMGDTFHEKILKFKNEK